MLKLVSNDLITHFIVLINIKYSLKTIKNSLIKYYKFKFALNEIKIF